MKIGEVLDKLPPDLAKAIGESGVIQIDTGKSAALVFRVINPGKGNSYLKVLPRGSVDRLLPEKKVMEWLYGKLPVPEVLLYREDERYEYMLTSEIPGTPCERIMTDISLAVRLMGEGLRLIHQVDTAGCPFARCLLQNLQEAEFRVKNGLIDTDLQPENMGVPPDELFRRLLNSIPDSEDLVFTHGDYCLPNIIIHRGKLSGFIDWGRAGIADRYQDLALAARSIRSNLGDKWVRPFFAAYGIRDIDWDKVDFYILLDEFF